LLVHAEVDCGAEITCQDQRTYANFLESRPEIWEIKAIEIVIRLVRETGCSAHIVHLSAAGALAILREAREEGLPITVETCPHYLCLTAEEIQDGETLFKCAPPIRENANRMALWQGLKDGIIDFVVSDHSPCTPNLKKLDTGNFTDAWGGISSLQLGLSNIWTTGQDFGISLLDLSTWLSRRPSIFAGISNRKGKIAKGHDADFVVWNPEESFLLQPQDLRFRHKMSPYLGRNLKGRIHYTYLRGKLAYEQGAIIGKPQGKPIFHRGI
jgi:allantoinase